MRRIRLPKSHLPIRPQRPVSDRLRPLTWLLALLTCGLFSDQSYGFTYVLGFWQNQGSSITCPTTGGSWVAVPGDPIYGTPNFCVQKYAAADVSGVPTAQAGSVPWVSINQTDAKAKCSALGAGYHLITNPEWMTVAANIANVGSNWSGGTVGSGSMSRGHSDNSPAQACAANANDANAWVDGAGDCTGKTQGSFAFNQRRTQNLSNGSVIWDFGGNVWQWVDGYNPNNKPVSTTLWVEYSALGNGTTDWPRSAFVPLNSVQSWWTNSWNSTQSIGQIYPGTNDSGGALIRGGASDAVTGAGAFAASLYNPSSLAVSVLGFRCAYQPTTYTVTYNANGATSGTVPTDSTAYAATQPVTTKNSGTLVRTGYNFAGWNTQANGGGTSYTAGGIMTMGAANVTLYALWAPSTCGDSGNSCYAYSLATGTTATTPTGKSLILDANGIWVENGGTRVLAADGSDAWQMGLSPDGRSFSSTAINKANVAGRACPGSVYINDNVMVASSRCLYYDAGNAAQRPDAAGTSQTTLGQIGFSAWGDANTGNSAAASWYEGNIQTCAAKGMRLPTLYETTANNPGSWLPTDATPTWSGTRVPEVGAADTWTATAFTAGGNQFRTWLGTTSGAPNNTYAIAVRCVVPYAPLAYAIAYDANSATSGSVPTDSNSYATGQRLTVAANTGSLARTGYTFAGWNTQANGGGINYAAGSSYVFGTSSVTLYARWVQPLNCSGLAGGTWVSVLGDGVYGTSDFCVQKYIASNVSSVPTSQTATDPWSATYAEATAACSGLGTGYHLMTNPEWMTIATNLLSQPENWTGGSVGSGIPLKGHSDNYPGQSCPAATSDANAWVHASCTGTSSGTDHQRRTFYLSDDSIIWDIGGNGWQLVNHYEPAPRQVSCCADVLTAGTAATPLSAILPRNNTQSWWNDSWGNSNLGIGRWSSWNPGYLVRGGTHTSISGIFSFGVSNSGLFRCAYTPTTTYTVAYDANGATSGTVPTTSGHGAGQTVTTAANSGTLARSGYVFNGWNTAANGSGTNYTAGTGTFTMGTANVTLYAKWVLPTYTITYSGNGATSGTAPTDNSAYGAGQTVTVASNSGTLARTNYSFAGWNTVADGSGTTYAPSSTLTMGATNLTLYAMWGLTNDTVNFTASGSWTVPAWVNSITVKIWGGGGGGNYAPWNAGAGGGGGGGAATKTLSVTPGSTITFTVGAGGAEATAGGTTSCLGMTAYGGAAGSPSSGSTGGNGGAGGTATGGSTNWTGTAGAKAPNLYQGPGGAGGAGGGSGGAGGAGGVWPGPASPGSAPGGGGGGGRMWGSGAAGATGMVQFSY